MSVLEAKLIANNIPNFQREVYDEIGKAVAKVAFDILANAIEHSPVLTGHLKGSNYATEISKFEWEVGNSASYAAHVNYGTRFMTARPFFSNAVEANRSKLAEYVQLAITNTVNKHALH